MKLLMRVLFFLVIAAAILFSIPTSVSSRIISSYNSGDKIDSLNGVYVYYNGGMTDTYGRNTIDGYNVGLKYQCVEFVKRYYLFYFKHKMPNPWGHAKDFYNHNLANGEKNIDRGLYQFCNNSTTKPKVNDLIIFDAVTFNPYGHVAIISKVQPNGIEIVQQNVGSTSRTTIKMSFENNKYKLHESSALGWLSTKK